MHRARLIFVGFGLLWLLMGSAGTQAQTVRLPNRLPIGSTFNPSHPLWRGLASWYPVLQPWAAGRTWYGAVANVHGSFQGGSSWVPDRTGRFEGVVVLNGTDGAVDFGTAPFHATLTSVCLTAQKATAVTEYMHLWETAPSTVDAGWVLETGGQFTDAGVDDLIVFINNGSAVFGQTTSGLMTANTPRCLCFVYDGSQASNATRLRIYIDGAPQTLTFSGTIPASMAAVSTSLLLGQPRVPPPDSFWNGSATNLLLWLRALSATEITQVCQMRTPTYGGLLQSDDILFASTPLSVRIKRRVQQE